MNASTFEFVITIFKVIILFEFLLLSLTLSHNHTSLPSWIGAISPDVNGCVQYQADGGLVLQQCSERIRYVCEKTRGKYV